MSTIAFTDNIPSATAKTGYLAGIVASGATDGHLSVTNTGDVPANFNYRTPGQTVWTPKTLNPLSSEEFTYVYNTNNLRTIEYTFDAGIIQLSVVDWWTQGSSDAPVTVITDGTPGGSAGSPKVGDISSGISAGTTIGTFLFTNTGDAPLTLNVRKTGTTTYDQFQLNPMTSAERTIALTSARTIEYYFDASAITVKVVVTAEASPVSVDWIRSNGLGGVYSTVDIDDGIIQSNINSITRLVNAAASIHLRKSMYALDEGVKIETIKEGVCWKVLMELHNKGMSRGLEAQSPRVSLQTAKDFQDNYNMMIARINSGIYY